MGDWPEETDDHRPEKGRVSRPPAHSEGHKKWVDEERVTEQRGFGFFE